VFCTGFADCGVTMMPPRGRFDLQLRGFSLDTCTNTLGSIGSVLHSQRPRHVAPRLGGIDVNVKARPTLAAQQAFQTRSEAMFVHRHVHRLWLTSCCGGAVSNFMITPRCERVFVKWLVCRCPFHRLPQELGAMGLRIA
jgi:hypothetical protein